MRQLLILFGFIFVYSKSLQAAEQPSHQTQSHPSATGASWQPEGVDSVDVRAKYLQAKLKEAKASSVILDQLMENGTQALLIGENHNESEDYYPKLFKYLKDRHGSVCLLMEYPDAFNSSLHRYQKGEIEKKKFDRDLDVQGYSPVSAEILEAAKDLKMRVDFIDAFTRNKVPTARFRIRNEHMADSIEKKLSDCKFAVVILGANHLIDEAGHTGIDELLRKRGIKVKSARVLRVPLQLGRKALARVSLGYL